MIAALCLEDAGAITGQIFLVSRECSGLFRPLEADQQATAEAPTVEAVRRVLQSFRIHPLDGPY